MSYLFDLDDFSTVQLRDEIRKRERASQEGKCWYCTKNVDAHTCKHAVLGVAPGWDVAPASYISGDDCMGREYGYYRTWATHIETRTSSVGVGDTRDEATRKCLASIKELEHIWREAFVQKPTKIS